MDVTYGIAAIVVIIVLLGIGWKYWRRKVSIVEMKQDSDDELLNTAAYKPKTPRSSQEKLDRLYEQLIHYFETEKPYLNKQLKSADIAAALLLFLQAFSKYLLYFFFIRVSFF